MQKIYYFMNVFLLYNLFMLNMKVRTKDLDRDTTNTISVASRLVNLLEEMNVDTVFGYPGAAVLPIYNSLSESKIRHVLCRHEQGAVHAAEGYAKVKNRAGVVLVTSGPGFTNTITGILNAYSDKTPLVIISGQVQKLNNNEFQSVDIENMAKTCTKAVYEIKDPNEIDQVIKRAFHVAQEIPKGPVIVTVSKTVSESMIKDFQPYKIKKEIKVEAPHSCVLKAIETLRNANRPVIIAGGGCTGIENELSEFSHLTHIPVVNTLMGKGIADDISLGLIGQSGEKSLNDFIQKADVVLALGVRFTNRTTDNAEDFLPNSKIISINIERNTSDNVQLEKEFIGELEVILQQMIGTIKAKNILFDIKYDWLESIPQNSFGNKKYIAETDRIISLIYEYSKKYHPIITTDVGEHQISVAKIFKTSSPRKFLTSGGFGTMGFGLPSAVGGYFASPNSLILNITGDGSFQMNMQELGTVSEHNIPVKIFIINNSSLGMIETTQISKYNKKYQSSLINPDFKKIAESYGIQAYSVRGEYQLEKTLKEIFKYKKAVLVDIKI